MVYWLLDIEYIVHKYQVQLTPSANDRGDPCHYDLRGLSDSQAGRMYKATQGKDKVYICLGDTPTLANEERLMKHVAPVAEQLRQERLKPR